MINFFDTYPIFFQCYAARHKLIKKKQSPAIRDYIFVINLQLPWKNEFMANTGSSWKWILFYCNMLGKYATKKHTRGKLSKISGLRIACYCQVLFFFNVATRTSRSSLFPPQLFLMVQWCYIDIVKCIPLFVYIPSI